MKPRYGQSLSYLLLILMAFSCSYLPEQEDISSYENVQKETGDYILLYRTGETFDHAFLFVPGGLVDPHVYLCWMNALVDMNPGLAIISLKVPSNLAISNQKKALKILDEFPEIEHWIIGGHSLGGVVSASSIKNSPDSFEGLVFLASWTTDFADISAWEGKVLSIYGSDDGVADFSEIEVNSKYLPAGVFIDSISQIETSKAQTVYYEIQGGNHSGFGCYGMQDGDNVAGVSAEKQQSEMQEALRTFFNAVWK